MTKKSTKTVQVSGCKPDGHIFQHLETSAVPSNPYNGQLAQAGYHGTMVRTFRLYCSKCGEVRQL